MRSSVCPALTTAAIVHGLSTDHDRRRGQRCTVLTHPVSLIHRGISVQILRATSRGRDNMTTGRIRYRNAAVFLITLLTILSKPTVTYAQFSYQDCQSEINRMREIYIVILRKIPAMPPLAQLSRGIQRALNDAESSRDARSFDQCVVQMRKQIQIVEGYAQ
jgi:hypothetical protein